MADVTLKVTPKDDVDRLDATTVAAVADKLKKADVDAAHILAVVEKITQTPPDLAAQAVIEKLKELQVDPAKIALVLEKLKQLFPQAKGIAFDPVVAGTVLTTGVGVIKKLNVGEGIKSLLIKLAIFAFGIFCGIGIVYKSGLPLPSDNPAVNPPAANVSVYQKRIEELQTENAQLRKMLEQPPVQPEPPLPDPNEPPVWPLPKEQPQPQPKTNPPVNPPAVQPVRPGEVRPGFVLPK